MGTANLHQTMTANSHQVVSGVAPVALKTADVCAKVIRIVNWRYHAKNTDSATFGEALVRCDPTRIVRSLNFVKGLDVVALQMSAVSQHPTKIVSKVLFAKNVACVAWWKKNAPLQMTKIANALPNVKSLQPVRFKRGSVCCSVYKIASNTMAVKCPESADTTKPCRFALQRKKHVKRHNGAKKRGCAASMKRPKAAKSDSQVMLFDVELLHLAL